jgi:hypothetical protein
VTLLFLQSCFLYAAYGIYRTIKDINGALTTVNSSMTKIQSVLKEGKDLKRAAADGQLISTLADKIPTLIQGKVEQATKDKINNLSGNLKAASLDFTKNAAAENLAGANQAYNNMATTYNQFTNLMTELSPTAPAK